ncbi:MAG TPA: sigma-54 dependent transcriptional regulator [Candidatus Limnocylindrales bacterium]|nr:sigma-54 dependent transcriptional regulator [Candidatus Limnocylindrales bacterium]
MVAPKILVVDDDKNLLELAKTRLAAANYGVTVALGQEEALEAVNNESFDLAIVDLRLADEDGITLMEKLHAIFPGMPVIILTGHASVEGAVDAMKRGAYTYLTKPFDPRELILQIGRALESCKLASENQMLKGMLKEKYDFANIVAKSDKMQRVLEAVSRIAKTDSTVYIHGESGTGKELIAKAIHLASPRKDKPFVAINCAAIPETLLESELFGHEKGAFTGAVRSTKGLFTQANEGTLFLDEIGDMPLSIQVKLLRALEERQFYPVGGEKPVQVDVRVVVATKKDLVEEVKKGQFREDLFYRIHVIPIVLPPLKDRIEDIPYLVDHLLKKISQQMKRDVNGLTPKAMEKLMQHDWPGNVRELENTLEYAVTMTQRDVVTDDLVLQTKVSTGAVATTGDTIQAQLLPTNGSFKTLKEARSEFERAYLVRLLHSCNGKATRAAEIAGKYRADFYDLLKKHDIKLAEFKRFN